MTNKMTINAQKLAYILSEFPDKKIAELIDLLNMPAIDINTAVWTAIDTGMMSEPDKKTGEVKLLRRPGTWDFGKDIEDLKEALVFAFNRLGGEETDLEENYLSQWTRGYAPHDILIAMRQLLADKKIAEYAIEDGDSTYIFYTAYKNKAKKWGRKQFKKDPLADAEDNKVE